jgi:hypothetical protein
VTSNPRVPTLLGTTGTAGRNPSPYNDFILHNSQRRGDTLLLTEEDYIDTDEVPPGGCRGQGKFETWDISRLGSGKITPVDTWETELNGMFTGGAVDSKAPVTVNCSSHWFDAKLPEVPQPERHPAGRLLHPGQRIDLGRVLVADRPVGPDRLHGRRLPRRGRGEDRQPRPERQEGAGAGAERVVRHAGVSHQLVLGVVPVAPDLRLRLPGAEGGREQAVDVGFVQDLRWSGPGQSGP